MKCRSMEQMLSMIVCEPLPNSPYRARLLATVGMMPHALLLKQSQWQPLRPQQPNTPQTSALVAGKGGREGDAKANCTSLSRLIRPLRSCCEQRCAALHDLGGDL